jgi:hypothetical protein
VEGAAIPGDAEEREALYRALLADRLVLVVLDTTVSMPSTPSSSTSTPTTHRRLLAAPLPDGTTVPMLAPTAEAYVAENRGGGTRSLISSTRPSGKAGGAA